MPDAVAEADLVMEAVSGAVPDALAEAAPDAVVDPQSMIPAFARRLTAPKHAEQARTGGPVLRCASATADMHRPRGRRP